jgi:4a-hydroxytetrahydrobiopterin dehydratase
MEPLEPAQVRAVLSNELGSWQLDGDAIVRELRFDGFREAIAFIVRLADVADAANHHPELTNVYSRVTVRLTTHDAGGVTEKDLALAREVEALVAA